MSRTDALEAFAEAYTRRMPEDEAPTIDGEQLDAEIRFLFDFVDERGRSPLALRTFNPKVDTYGYDAPGTVVEAEPYPEARKPAIKLWIDFGGEIGEKRTSAQITAHYTPEALVGTQVLAVVNFPPRQIGKFMSEVLVLGMPDQTGEVVLVGPDQAVPNGGRLH